MPLPVAFQQEANPTAVTRRTAPFVLSTQLEKTVQTKTTDRPVDQAIAAIKALDLDPIRLRVMDKESGEGWTREYAETIEQAYRAYLTMLVKHPEDAEDIVVSKDVDEFWHAHILHTMKYTEDCEKVFGAYLHHNPHVGERTQADIERKARQAEKTRRLYAEEIEITRRCRGAYLGDARQAQNAAFCGAGVQGSDAAFCGADVQSEKAAFCGASIERGGAAFCGASVQAKDAAFCGADVRAKKMAFCGASVRAADGTLAC